MSLVPGARLGPYEIVALLGAGGMGEVYHARDSRLDRSVAVKVLSRHLTESPERRARFEREAKAVSSLNHPHIYTLHDVGRQDGTDYIHRDLKPGSPGPAGAGKRPRWASPRRLVDEWTALSIIDSDARLPVA